jgi:hypothetical protein
MVLAGVLVWAAALGVLRPGWPEAMLLLASLVIVPLGLGLIAPPGRHARLRTAADRLRVPAAWTLVASFALPPGWAAAALALPWLAVTVAAALGGLGRLRAEPRTPAGLCLGVGPIYLAVGGAWSIVARAGLRPLGFPDVIVLMTAVHFHYAGFALLVLAGRAAGALGGPAASVACLGAVAGVPLVAAGITDAQLMPGLLPPRAAELAATGVMAVAGALVGLLQVQIAARQGRPPLARALLGVSGLAILVPMGLAWLYALGAYRHVVWIDILGMFRYHGAVNALGFALPGLLAWHVAPHTGWEVER